MSQAAVASTNKLHTLSEGIRRKQVGDADILAVAAESSAKKRKANPNHDINVSITIFISFHSYQDFRRI